jgi:hypothetical protein
LACAAWSAVCAKPLSGIIAAIEITDAPKISAREYLAPSAIHQTQSSCVLFGWRAPHEASDWLANL